MSTHRLVETEEERAATMEDFDVAWEWLDEQHRASLKAMMLPPDLLGVEDHGSSYNLAKLTHAL